MTDQQMNVVILICSIVFPPLGVFFMVGFKLHFFINILLCLLGYIPGVVHALWIYFYQNKTGG